MLLVFVADSCCFHTVWAIDSQGRMTPSRVVEVEYGTGRCLVRYEYFIA